MTALLVITSAVLALAALAEYVVALRAASTVDTTAVRARPDRRGRP